MYEPYYIPKLKNADLLSGNVCYSLTHSTKFVRPNDDGLDELHIHGYIEIFFNVASDVSFFVNDKLLPVGNGDAVISHPNEVHKCVFNSAKNHEYFCLWIDTNGNSSLSSHFPKNNLLSFDKDTKEEIFSLLFRLYKIDEGGNEVEKTRIILQIIESLKNNRPSGQAKTILPNSFQAVLTYISENFANLKTVQEVADKFFISPTTLLRNFNKYLCISPRKYLEQVKLSNAVQLLNQGSSVTEASLNSGFSDVSHFIVLFKKKFGTSPFKYKNTK